MNAEIIAKVENCDVCKQPANLLLAVGESMDYEQTPINVCLDCVIEGASVLQEKLRKFSIPKLAQSKELRHRRKINLKPLPR